MSDLDDGQEGNEVLPEDRPRRMGRRIRTIRDEVPISADRVLNGGGGGAEAEVSEGEGKVALDPVVRRHSKLVPDAGEENGGDDKTPSFVKVYRGMSHISGFYLGSLTLDDDEESLRELGGGGPYCIQVCNVDGKVVTNGVRRVNLPGDMKPGTYLTAMFGTPGSIAASAVLADGVPGARIAGGGVADDKNVKTMVEFITAESQKIRESARESLAQMQTFMQGQMTSQSNAHKQMLETMNAANERASTSERTFTEALMKHQGETMKDLATRLASAQSAPPQPAGSEALSKMQEQMMDLTGKFVMMAGDMATKITSMGAGPSEPAVVQGIRVAGDIVRPIAEKFADAFKARNERAAQTVRAARIIRRPVVMNPVPIPTQPAPEAAEAAEAPRRRFAPSEPDNEYGVTPDAPAAPVATEAPAPNGNGVMHLVPTDTQEPHTVPQAEDGMTPLDRIDQLLNDEFVTPEQMADETLKMAQAGQIQPFIMTALVESDELKLMVYCRRFGRGHWTQEPLRSRLIDGLAVLREAMERAQAAAPGVA